MHLDEKSINYYIPSAKMSDHIDRIFTSVTQNIAKVTTFVSPFVSPFVI